MKKLLLIALLAAVPLFAFGSGAPSAPSPYTSVQNGFELSARRVHAEDTFEIRAVFTDTATGKVIASPSMKVHAGKWAQLSIGSPSELPPAVSLSASVDPSGKLVAFLAQARQSDGDRRTYSGTAFVSP